MLYGQASTGRMSYILTLDCGCNVAVSCDPKTQGAQTRILETRGSSCTVRKHTVGLRLFLWDLLPDRGADRPAHRDWCGWA